MIIVESIIVIIIYFICIIYPTFLIVSVILPQVPIKYRLLILCEASPIKGSFYLASSDLTCY